LWRYLHTSLGYAGLLGNGSSEERGFTVRDSTRDSWRQRSLAAGFELLQAHSDTEGLVALQAVADHLDTSDETIGRAWRLPSEEPKSHFLRKFVLYACSIERFRSVAELPDMIRALAESPNLLKDARGLLEGDFDLIAEEPGFGVQLRLMSGTPRRTLRASLAAMYQGFDKELVAPLDDLFDALGREVVSPYRTKHLAALLNGLVEGMAMRARIDDDPATLRKVYVDAVLTLALTWTRPIGSNVTLESRIGELDTWGDA
jgi:hypothetical protein